jgi:serine/threonine protein kinase, bacterial
MTNRLIDTARTDRLPRDFLADSGEVFAEFGVPTQDSGNVSYGISLDDGQRYFVKTAGQPDDPLPFLPHGARVELLRNAVRLNARFRHSALPELHNVIEAPTGPLLVYAWVDGELLNVPQARREDPTSSYQRFRSMPAQRIVDCLDTIFAVQAGLGDQGWVAADFYDGSLIYDFTAHRLHIVDLDFYQAGPFVNEMGRMFGSSRFMAPEEFRRGAIIDSRTNVFTMGRTALLLLGDGTTTRAAFRGTDAQYAVIERACSEDPERRHPTLASFHTEWRSATGHSSATC